MCFELQASNKESLQEGVGKAKNSSYVNFRYKLIINQAHFKFLELLKSLLVILIPNVIIYLYRHFLNFFCIHILRSKYLLTTVLVDLFCLIQIYQSLHAYLSVPDGFHMAFFKILTNLVGKYYSSRRILSINFFLESSIIPPLALFKWPNHQHPEIPVNHFILVGLHVIFSSTAF